MYEATADPAPAPAGVLAPAVTPPVPVSRRHDVIAVCILIAVVSILFVDVLTGINNFYMRDLTRYYYPAKQILREIVYRGEFPYWNPYFSAGQPIAANPEHEVFYPLTWLILLPSYDFGFRLHILIHIYIGVLGMYALLRSMELRPPAAYFGAVSFALGGLYLSYVNLLPILFCAAWLPLTCLYVRRFLFARRARDFAIASLFLGLQFLVGEPTTVMQTGFLIGMYALYRAWYSPRRIASAIRNVFWIAAISATSFAIGAAQMLSAIDHVRDSARSRPFDFDLVKAWSMPWAKLAELIYPNILGHIAIDRIMWYWGGGLYSGMGSPFLFSIYSGLLIAALVIAGAFTRPRGGRFILILVLFSLIIALGGNTPVLEYLYKANIASSIRYPEKFIMVAMFALVIFAAQMFQRAVDGDAELRDSAAGFALATALVAGIIALLAFTTPWYAMGFTRVWGLSPGPIANRYLALSRIDWTVAFARGTILVVLLATLRTRRRELWIVAALTFVTVDVSVACYELNPRMPRRFFTEPPPVAGTLPPNRADYRVFHEADWYGTEDPARKFFSTGDAVYWIVRDGLFPMTPAGQRIRTVLERDYDKTALHPTVDLTDSIWDVKRSGRADWWQPFMFMSNAWYRGVYRDYEVERKRTRGDFKKVMPIQFLESGHYPRYYFADQLVQIRDRADFVKKLTSDTYSSRVGFISGKTFVPAGGTVLKATESANTARLDVESRGLGFLIMSVTPHKYWRVSIDGRRVTPIITNIGYQGVSIPAGRHVVDMRYQNDVIRVGALISAAAVTLVLLMIVFTRRMPAPAV